MTREQLANELSMHAKDCLVRLEGFKEAQTQYITALKALRVFNGEKLGGGVAKKAGAPPRKAGGRVQAMKNAGEARTLLQGFLRKRRAGATVAQLAAHIKANGAKADSNTIHNLLRSFSKLGVLERVDGEGTAKIYKLKG